MIEPSGQRITLPPNRQSKVGVHNGVSPSGQATSFGAHDKPGLATDVPGKTVVQDDCTYGASDPRSYTAKFKTPGVPETPWREDNDAGANVIDKGHGHGSQKSATVGAPGVSVDVLGAKVGGGGVQGNRPGPSGASGGLFPGIYD